MGEETEVVDFKFKELKIEMSDFLCFEFFSITATVIFTYFVFIKIVALCSKRIPKMYFHALSLMFLFTILCVE